MSPKRRYLQSVKGNYRYRRRWPKHVASRANGQFFLKHLQTSDLDEAIRMRPAIDLQFDAEVARLERETDTRPRKLSEAEAITLAGKWFAEAEELTKEAMPRQLTPGRHEGELAHLDDMLSEYREQLGTGDLKEAGRAAEEFLREQGIMAEPDGRGYLELLRLILRAKIELTNMERAWLIGDYAYQPDDPVFASQLASPDGPERRTLNDLIEAYKNDREEGWSKSTRRAYGPIWRLLRDTLGSTRDLASIKRPEGRALFESVKALPTGLGKRKELRGLSVPEAIKLGAELGLPTLGPKSINDSYMSGLNAMFKWAVKEQWMDANPVEGLRVKDAVHPGEKRSPFTPEQLTDIFTNKPWTPGGDPKEKPINYWGPLIALFHGTRRGEIAMLETEGVREVEGHPVILIPKGKTKNARRMLPVHPELIRMGFLDYAEDRKRSGDRQLFEGETENSNGQWGDGLTDWFSRLLSARGVEGTLVGMHSFRHNFQDRLREAKLHGTAIGQELAGRSKGGDTSNNYGSGFATETLAEAIGKIEYPGLDLTHLHIGNGIGRD